MSTDSSATSHVVPRSATGTNRCSYLLERAYVDGATRDDVLVEIVDGRVAAVVPGAGAERAAGAERIAGLTVPGFANTHSHAFHRALRGRTQRERGTFWSWREQMYAVAERLDPDSYFALARATYREMVAAGITCVGEFHYLHHQPDGSPYADPNAMGAALVAAAREAGLRIALLDTVYLSSGFGARPEGVQVRYSDGDAEAWATRVRELDGADDVVIGAAIHSVRAVPDDQLVAVAETAAGLPLHVHLSEQRAENEACVAAYGATPTQLLNDHGVLGPLTTAVHATHLTDDDIAHLGATATYAGLCPTTERDLGDGIGPSRRLHDSGSALTLGSDSQAVIDPFEEMRAVELDERLATERRGHWSAAELLNAATVDGHRSLGFADAGAIAVGRRADMVTIDPASSRTAGAGADEQAVVFAASAADVLQVITDGRVVFTADRAGDVGRELDDVLRRLWA